MTNLMLFDICVNDKKYDLYEGQRFYHNNYGTAKGHTLPDYLNIVKVIKHDFGYFIEAKYENHTIGTKERLLSDLILVDSNLNPDCEDPGWIFERKE